VNNKSAKKFTIIGVTVVIAILITIVYILFGTSSNVSSYPDTITINSKYYLQKVVSLNCTVADYKDNLLIVNDNSVDGEYSMGVCTIDGNILISPMYKDMCFVGDDTIKGWKSETEVYYFDTSGKVLDYGEYSELKDTYEVATSSEESYTIEEFQSTVYSTDEDGNPKKVLGKYVVYGTSQDDIVFPKNVKFEDVTIANITGKVFVGDVYDEIYYYSPEDKIALVKKDDQVYYCDDDGNPIFYVECNLVEDEDGNPCFSRKGYSELFPINMFDHGYAITVSGEKYGLINLEGKVIIDFNYDYIEELAYNLYVAKQGDSVAICDITTNEGLVSDYFKDIQPFEDTIVLYDETTNRSNVYTIEMSL
jgi:hypothetical protein